MARVALPEDNGPSDKRKMTYVETFQVIEIYWSNERKRTVVVLSSGAKKIVHSAYDPESVDALFFEAERKEGGRYA